MNRIVLNQPQTPQNAPTIHDIGFGPVVDVKPLPGIVGLSPATIEADFIAAIDRLLEQRHELWMREYARQFEKWCVVNGRPAYQFAVPDLTAQTNQALLDAAKAAANYTE